MLHICSKPILEKAQIDCLNYSSIFTELIQAASVCEYYSSDIYYDLKAIECAITGCENRVFFIGYRDNGIDGNTFIKSRFKENPHYKYIRLYRLEITCDGDYISAELKRVTEYDAQGELIGWEKFL